MDDLILRAAAIDAIGDLIKEYRDDGKDEMADGMIIARRYGIRYLPAVDAAIVIHARWVYEDNDPMTMPCSNCDYRVFRYNNTPFCPNCGADMRMKA